MLRDQDQRNRHEPDPNALFGQPKEKVQVLARRKSLIQSAHPLIRGLANHQRLKPHHEILDQRLRKPILDHPDLRILELPPHDRL